RATQGCDPRADSSPEWMAAFGPPPSQPAPPSKDARFFVQTMGSTSQSRKIESHLAHCGACASRLPEALHFAHQLSDLHRRATPGSSAERRREPRISTSDAATLRLLHPFSPKRLDIWILNVSKSGLGFQTDRPMEHQTIVQIRLNGVIILGEVCYCVPNDGAFVCGVAIQDVFPTPFSD